MKIGHVLKTTEFQDDRGQEAFFIDVDTGNLVISTTIYTPLSIKNFLSLLEDLKDAKETSGFDRKNVNHAFINDTDCDGQLKVIETKPDKIIYQCKKCHLYANWSWVEFCRYYDCR